MYRQEYQMVVTVPTADANDPNWPNKKIRFDASEWLCQSQYIKINDFYVLNTQYVPIADLNDFGVILGLQEAIEGASYRLPELSELTTMDAQIFKKLVEDKLTYEYLMTEFDSETLKPVNDHFLIFFTYRNVKYEVPVVRIISKTSGEYSYRFFENTVRKAGYWHNTDPAVYSYKDYVNGKKIK